MAENDNFETIDRVGDPGNRHRLWRDVFLLLFFSRYWSWYLWLLDARIWPPWKCIGFAVSR